MGMYSSVLEVDMECVKSDAFLSWLENKVVPEYLDKVVPEYLEYESYKETALEAWLNSNGDEVEFFMQLLDSSKIIGYWYGGWSIFMRDLAQFFEGKVHLQYEEPEVFAMLYFKDGLFTVSMGEISYENPMSIEQIAEIPELPFKERMFRVL